MADNKQAYVVEDVEAKAVADVAPKSNVHGNKNVYEVDAAPKKSAEPKSGGVEDKARKGGWAPKDEWRGDADDWVSAQEFNYRGELMRHIKRSNDELADVRSQYDLTQKALAKLGQVHAKTLAREKKEILEAIEAEKIEAINEGRGEDAVAADKKLEQVKNEFADMEAEEKVNAEEAKSNDDAPQYPPEYIAWSNQPENEWYGKDQFLTAKANLISQEYIVDYFEEHGSAPQAKDILDNLQEKIVAKYPDKFPGVFTRQQADDFIEPGGNPPSHKKSSTKKYTERDLEPDERKVIRQMAEASNMPVQDYITHLADLGELEIQQ